LASELGYLLPPVRVSDNLQLKSREYTILLKGSEIGRYELRSGCELAIQSGGTAVAVSGAATHEPAFHIPAVWITPDKIDAARQAGYTVVDPVSVLGTHLTEIIRRYACELFSRQDAKKVIDRVAVEQPKLIEDLVPKQISLGVVQKVMQNLLRERVSIRDANTILEALAEAASMTRNPILMTEFVRQAIRRSLVKPLLNAAGELPLYFCDADIEQTIEKAIEHGEQNSHLNLAPQAIRRIVERFNATFPVPESTPGVLTTSGARYFLRQITETALPALTIIAHNEVPPGVRVVSLGTVK
jgi:flagellar biosynthesis protein FlhA